MDDYKKAREGLKNCWSVINELNEEMVGSKHNDDWSKLKTSLKDIEYGYEDFLKSISNEQIKALMKE